jgi:cyclopropane fatty-acyl-phospholipid synthase-like methyltransferase
MRATPTRPVDGQDLGIAGTEHMTSDYGAQTLRNPSWLKRFTHRARFRKALELIAPTPGDRILDYGTGDGMLPVMLHGRQPGASISAYEPVEELRVQAGHALASLRPAVEVFGDRSAIAASGFNKISCLEVLEHLDEASLDLAFEDFRRLLSDGGTLLISVPVEVGFVALVKNAARWILGQVHEGTSLRGVWLSMTGRADRVERRHTETGYIHSHVGFDYRRLERKIAERGFLVEKRVFTPFGLFGSLANSQVFYVLGKPA